MHNILFMIHFSTSLPACQYYNPFNIAVLLICFKLCKLLQWSCRRLFSALYAELSKPFVSYQNECPLLSFRFKATMAFQFIPSSPSFLTCSSSLFPDFFGSSDFHYSTSTQIRSTTCSIASFMFLSSVFAYLFRTCPLQVSSSKKRSSSVTIYTSICTSDKMYPSTHSFSFAFWMYH